MRPFIIFSFLSVLVFGCEITLDRELPPHTPRLVFYSALQPGDSLRLYLTRSYGPLEDVTVNEILVEDATVTMAVNGTPVNQISYLSDTIPFFFPPSRSGYYLGEGVTIAPGDLVSMEVSHPDYETARGETRVPVPGSVKKVELIQNAYREVFDANNAYTQSILRVTFEDPAGVRNFYRAQEAFFSFYDSINAPGQLQFGALSLFGPAVPTSGGGFEGSGEYANDDGADGTDLVVDFLCEMPYAFAPATDWVEVQPENLWLDVEYANEDYAEYQEKLILQQSSSGSGISLTPSEPVELYSNIDGGYGVIGGFIVRTDSLAF